MLLNAMTHLAKVFLLPVLQQPIQKSDFARPIRFISSLRLFVEEGKETREASNMNQDTVAANYLRVGNVMRTYGKPNPTFPTDLDITYKELLEHVPTLSGLLNILKTMKQKVISFSLALA